MMNWNAGGLTDVSDSLVAADIFAVLNDAIRPLRALPIRPILFVRSERFTRAPGNFPNALEDAPRPLFYIQYGPRAWKSAHLYPPSPFTDFGEPILAMGKTLEKKNGRLSAGLSSP